ncbi:MAG: hypothetical protein AB1Z55_06310, partial [Acidimicrobiia bacterium]
LGRRQVDHGPADAAPGTGDADPHATLPSLAADAVPSVTDRPVERNRVSVDGGGGRCGTNATAALPST